MLGILLYLINDSISQWALLLNPLVRKKCTDVTLQTYKMCYRCVPDNGPDIGAFCLFLSTVPKKNLSLSMVQAVWGQVIYFVINCS